MPFKTVATEITKMHAPSPFGLFVALTFAIVLTPLFALLPPAHAADSSLDPVEANTPQEAVEAVISGQMQAFQTRDLDLALSFAAQSIRSLFPTSARFGEMVKQGYLTVWDNAQHQFVQFQTQGTWAQQIVLVTDLRGQKLLANYTLTFELGEWKIAGVQGRQMPPDFELEVPQAAN